jgi:hypothetical protein
MISKMILLKRIARIGPLWMLLILPTSPREALIPHQVADGNIELPQLSGLNVPAGGQSMVSPQIASAFFGCWAGIPGRFDSISGAPGPGALSALRRVALCYLPSRIETDQFDLELEQRHATLHRVLRVIGLAHLQVRIVRASADIYETSERQIHSRGALTLEIAQSSLFSFGSTSRVTVIDEEVATLVGADVLSIVGRTFLINYRPGLPSYPSEVAEQSRSPGARALSVGTWHADLHR